MTTEDVLNHHLEAFGAGDLDGIMEDYTESSVLILPDTTLTGLDAIREGFNGLLTTIFAPGTFEFNMGRAEVSGDIAYIVWSSTGENGNVKLGTDTYLVRDGKIAIQTFAAHIE